METIANWLTDVVGPTWIFWGFFGFALKEIVEYAKAGARGIHGLAKLPDWAYLGGYGSLALVVFLGMGATYQFDLNLFEMFESLKDTDPELAALITSAVGIGFARFFKKKQG